MIKEKKKHAFEHVDADALVLWSVSMPADETLEEEFSKLELVDERSLMPLEKAFSGLPEEGHLQCIGPSVGVNSLSILLLV
jgi:Crinkler effector protein N-terminal domain